MFREPEDPEENPFRSYRHTASVISLPVFVSALLLMLSFAQPVMPGPDARLGVVRCGYRGAVRPVVGGRPVSRALPGEKGKSPFRDAHRPKIQVAALYQCSRRCTCDDWPCRLRADRCCSAHNGYPPARNVGRADRGAGFGRYFVAYAGETERVTETQLGAFASCTKPSDYMDSWWNIVSKVRGRGGLEVRLSKSRQRRACGHGRVYGMAAMNLEVAACFSATQGFVTIPQSFREMRFSEALRIFCSMALGCSKAA